MNIAKGRKSRGYVLIEALVAVLIVALGMMALTRLEAQIIGSAGDAKARSIAMALARSQIESLRNAVLPSQFPPTPAVAASPATIIREGVEFTMTTTLTQPDTSRNDRLVRVAVTWLDRAGNTQTVALNSIVAWNDPELEGMTQQNLSKNIISPTGAAKRGSGAYRPGQTTTVQDGSTQPDKITRLLNADGETILYLEPTPNGNVQRFGEIHGRVYFDNTVNSNQLPATEHVYVRLSSEGECVYDHAAAHLSVLPVGATGNAIKYQYFSYICYVGPGWYGNVGVTLIGDNATPTVCVGDPKFTDSSFTATPKATESTTRSYRGFRAQTVNNVTTYISTGMFGGSIYGDDGSNATIKAGKPKPFDYPSIYTWVTSSGAANDFFDQDFLVSKITGNGTCSAQMSLIANANTFSPNAGKYYCINPDNWTEDATGNQCPNTWPGFPAGGSCGAITVSGSINYTNNNAAVSATTSIGCTNANGDACSCQVTAGTANYQCATNGSSSAALTITGVGTVTVYDNNWTAPTCIPSGSCVPPANTTSTQYQCAQSSCSSGNQLTQSRSVTYGNWSNTACVPTSSCSAPADTSTTKYRCVQSGCISGEAILQTSSVATVTITDSDNTSTTNSVVVSTACSKNSPSGSVPATSTTSSIVNGVTTTTTTSYSNGTWSNTGVSCGSPKTTWNLLATKTVRTVVTHKEDGPWADTDPTCSTTNPTYVMSDGSVQYQYVQGSCSGQNKVLQHRTVTFGNWADISPTCVGISAPLPVTSGQVWQSTTTGCASGLKQFQSKGQVGAPTTTTCTRILNPLGCSSLSGVNIDSSTPNTTCQ